MLIARRQRLTKKFDLLRYWPGPLIDRERLEYSHFENFNPRETPGVGEIFIDKHTFHNPRYS